MMNTGKIFISLSLTALIAACGSGEAEMNGDIAALYAKKDSLRNLKNAIAVQINEVEEQINLMDTNGGSLPYVTAEVLKKKRFRHFFEVQGAVESEHNAEVTSEAAGKITSISVKEGQSVQAGQILIQLDDRVIKNSIDELKSQLDLAQTVYEKQKTLWDKKIGSEIQYLEAKTNVETLEGRLETMNAQLAMYKVKAPFDGIVDEIYPKSGEMASPMMPMVRMVNLKDVYIKSDVSERYLSNIKVGDTAMVEFPSLKILKASAISRIGNYINPNNRTFKIRFELDNKDYALKPNLLAKINIMDYSNPSTLVIPAKVIRETPQGEEFVFVLAENGSVKVERRTIKTGLSYQGFIEVLEGLNEGERLVIQGGNAVKDGDIVEVNEI